MDALQLLDYDSWQIVLENVSTDDLFNCRLVCKTFNQILDLQQFHARWKFPAILPLIFDHLLSNEWHNPWKHLHSLRLVCQIWRLSMDKYTSEVHGSTISFGDPLVTVFETAERIEEFQQTFGEDPNINPFPSRIVALGNSDPFIDEFQATIMQVVFIDKIGVLLEQFGRNIFKLNLLIFFAYIDEDPLSLCKLVRKISIHLPNLKALMLGSGPPRYAYENYEEYDKYHADVDRRVATFIEENALAELPQFKELQVNGLDIKVEKYLLDKYAPQLTNFDRKYQTKLLPQVYGKEFRNLRKLSIELLDRSNDTLEILRYLKSPLKELKLQHCDFIDDLRWLIWSVDKVLCNIKHLPIEILEIGLFASVSVIEAGLELEEYRNESIQTLRIHTNSDDRDLSFNFIQALKRLEKLELRFFADGGPQTHPEDIPQVVNLNEYLTGEEETELPYQSNVWEKVPSLKNLILKRERQQQRCVISVYSRETYNEKKGMEQNAHGGIQSQVSQVSPLESQLLHTNASIIAVTLTLLSLFLFSYLHKLFSAPKDGNLI